MKQPFRINRVISSIAATALPLCSQACADPPQAPPPPAKSAADRSLPWSRPRSSEREAERRQMVETQIAARGVKNADVLEAMRAVPRHWFVPEKVAARAYDDTALPIGEDQTISQPFIVALMTEALGLTHESKVLEIGTGSGYQAAVLAEITPHVFTIEIVEPLAQCASQAFKGYGYESIKARAGDGYQGWPGESPFDAVIVTCAPDHIPPKLVEQLKPGGRICIPVGDEHDIQWLRLATKSADGRLAQSDMIPVRFVPMTGEGKRER